MKANKPPREEVGEAGMKRELSYRIMFCWLYPVCMFPAFITARSKRKLVRFFGILASIPWLVIFLPIMAVGVAITIPIMIWEMA